MMIRPVNFGFNAETAVNNAFQVPGQDDGAQEKALAEFDQFVEVLRSNEIDVTVIDDTAEPYTPDSIFPNNWISFHENNNIVLYPMFAVNRRFERKAHVLDTIKQKFKISEIYDLSVYEKRSLFLEGTGSMVLDHINRVAYAAVSPRTDLQVLNEFCRIGNYTPVSFGSKDKNGNDIYHTNVMMCIGDSSVVICLDAVYDKIEKEKLTHLFSLTKKEIIDISFNQMEHFAGNMLQLKNKAGELLIVMSTKAYTSLNKQQLDRLGRNSLIIHSSLDTIETCGGGSARCMMAEVFNQLK
jgi:hypothetical protein